MFKIVENNKYIQNCVTCITDGVDKKNKIDKKKLNILIVDDDNSSSELLKYLISARGHNVTIVDEGMICVNRCSENSFDLIFMDYHIGDLDGELTGMDITKMIREYFDTTSIIYAYTGDDTTATLNEIKNTGINGIFIKPIEPTFLNEFFSIIEKNIDDCVKLSRLAIKQKKFKYLKNEI